MNFENDIFKRTNINPKALINYGFIKKGDVYKYTKVFMNNFRADIEINENGKVTGKIYDIDIGEEYINFRIESQNGAFVNKVRNEYINILQDIKANCFDNIYFIFKQANRITERIINKYKDYPEFPWTSSPGAGIFRNPVSKKWYGLIMNIDKSKIYKTKTGEIEVINVKLDDKIIPDLLKKKGIYPAYHMNKKYWVTIILDDTLLDEEIMQYITISHDFSQRN